MPTYFLINADGHYKTHYDHITAAMVVEGGIVHLYCGSDTQAIIKLGPGERIEPESVVRERAAKR